MAIEIREFGKTGAQVSIMGFGSSKLRGLARADSISDEEAGRLLNAALDGGIANIDTGADYGKAEGLIGKYVGNRRDEFFLSSKCGCLKTEEASTPPWTHDYGATNIRANVEQSLRRLRTDHLDVTQIHSSPTREVLERDGTIEELVKLRDEGKIRFIGISGTLPNLRDHLAMGVFDSFQIPYSGLQREHEDLISEAASLGAGTIIRGGLARGVAAMPIGWQGHNDGTPGETELARFAERWRNVEISDLLDGMQPIEFMLRFTMSHPGLSTTVIATSSIDELQSNIRTAEKGPLPADVRAEAQLRFAKAGSTPA